MTMHIVQQHKRRFHVHLMHLQNHWSIGVGAENKTEFLLIFTFTT